MATILLVEDDEQIRTLLREFLEHHGYKVFEAQNGREAITQFSEHLIDVTIMDILLPDKDGLETIQDLRRKSPDAKVIAISGGFDREGVNILKMAERLGALHTLLKPFEMEKLLTTVRETLQMPPFINT